MVIVNENQKDKKTKEDVSNEPFKHEATISRLKTVPGGTGEMRCLVRRRAREKLLSQPRTREEASIERTIATLLLLLLLLLLSQR